MLNRFKYNPLQSNLVPHWCIVVATLLVLAIYLITCKNITAHVLNTLPEAQRLSIRTLCYAIGIVLLPLTTLIRYVQVRLNQTMPGNKSANKRYLLTITVSMVLIQSIGLLGVLMVMLGDDFNTLYILTAMSALGVFLHRPKHHEYTSITEALANGKIEQAVLVKKQPHT